MAKTLHWNSSEKRIQEIRMKHNIIDELVLLSMLKNDINHKKRIKSIIKSYKDVVEEKTTKDRGFEAK